MQDLSHASADWLLMRSRILEGRTSSFRADCERAAKEAHADMPRRGGGGAHRAWFSEKLQECNNLDAEGFQELWAEYHKMKAAGGEEWERLKRKGRAATLSAQQGGHAFGPKRRKRNSGQVLHEHGDDAGGAEPHGENLELVPSDDLLGRDSLQLALTRLEQQQRQAGAASSRQAAQDDTDFQAWVQRRLAESTFSDVGIASKDQQAGVQPVPGCTAAGLELECVQMVMPGSSMADHALAAADLPCKESMAKEWKKLHTIRKGHHEKQEKLSDPRSLCWHAGFCLCALDGLRGFVSALLKALRPLCAKGTTCRDLIKSNVFVLRVFVSDELEMFMIPTFVNLTTWHAAVLPLQQANEETMACAVGLGRLALSFDTALPRLGLQSWWQVFRQWDISKPASLTALRVHSSKCITQEFCLKDLDVETVYPMLTKEFWPGDGAARRVDRGPVWGGARRQPPRPAAPRPRRRPPLGQPLGLLDFDDAGSGDEEFGQGSDSDVSMGEGEIMEEPEVAEGEFSDCDFDGDEFGFSEESGDDDDNDSGSSDEAFSRHPFKAVPPQPKQNYKTLIPPARRNP